jgi:hypothetical protein
VPAKLSRRHATGARRRQAPRVASVGWPACCPPREVTAVVATRTLVGTAAMLAAVVVSAVPASGARSARRERQLTTSSGDAIELFRRPIAVYGREAGQPIYFIYIRLNRPVPRNSNHSPAATVRFGGLGLSRPTDILEHGFPHRVEQPGPLLLRATANPPSERLSADHGAAAPGTAPLR